MVHIRVIVFCIHQVVHLAESNISWQRIVCITQKDSDRVACGGNRVSKGGKFGWIGRKFNPRLNATLFGLVVEFALLDSQKVQLFVGISQIERFSNKFSSVPLYPAVIILVSVVS